jgi:hypothetical protein
MVCARLTKALWSGALSDGKEKARHKWQLNYWSVYLRMKIWKKRDKK